MRGYVQVFHEQFYSLQRQKYPRNSEFLETRITLSPTDENGNILEVQIEMETDPHYDLLSLALRLQEISKAFALVCFSCGPFFRSGLVPVCWQ